MIIIPQYNRKIIIFFLALPTRHVCNSYRSEAEQFKKERVHIYISLRTTAQRALGPNSLPPRPGPRSISVRCRPLSLEVSDLFGRLCGGNHIQDISRWG